MRRKRSVSPRLLVALCLAVALVPLVPTTALGFSGGLHEHAAWQACHLFMHDLYDLSAIQRNREVPLFPQLEDLGWWFLGAQPGAEEGEWKANWVWVYWNSKEADYHETVYDGYTSDTTTYTHFWEPEDGLRDHVEGIYDNAWEKNEILWMRAVNYWWAGPDNDGNAYAALGYVVHLVSDMGQPAHVHSDLHGPGNLDSLEQALSKVWAEANFDWFTPLGVQGFGDILYPPQDNQGILDAIYASGYSSEELADPDPDSGDPYLATVDPVYNMQQLFHIMYYVNQTASFFASDGADGNTDEPIGWLNNYADFDASLWHLTGPDSDDDWGPDPLDDNEDGCENGKPYPLCTDDTCDCDGDLTRIAMKGYAATFRAIPAVIDLFRRTVDNVPPVTTVEMTRLDGNPVVEWNNSPVTVRLTDAQDSGRGPGIRASGVWKVWGLCDGTPPAFDPGNTPYWALSQDGIHEIQCMSTDKCGNVEQDQDITIKIDMTPPEITFPDLRPNYLTSEDFIATWEATDAHSGVASEYALLDDQQQVTKGQVIDLAEMAGEHWLRVIAYDNAGNYTDIFYYFEVFIDANGWALPVLVANRTRGKGMFCVVEFPPLYDVGIINMTTCTLAVGATLDLTADDPVVGGLAVLPAELMTGVGDQDGDHIRDRMLRFDKKQFVAALGGQVGHIPAVVRGGLLPNGMPRFLGVMTVPVFSPGN